MVAAASLFIPRPPSAICADSLQASCPIPRISRRHAASAHVKNTAFAAQRQLAAGPPMS
jgi:hypothetical protein